MAEDGVNIVVLEDNYYRDRFGKVIFSICLTGFAILLLTGIAVYNYFNKPPPVTFSVAQEWRVLAPVPKDQAYLTDPDVLQWVSRVIPEVFSMDFLQMDAEIADAKKYFTDSGFQVYLNQLNNFADRATMQAGKIFLLGKLTSAPIIDDKGILVDRYAWKVQIPVKLRYAEAKRVSNRKVTFTVLVVRTDTTDNLTGILIDNIEVAVNKDSELVNGKQ